MMIQSAGYIIVDFSGAEPTALCLMDNYHQWDFPKGHVERKETVQDAATRETMEESGLTTSDFLPSGLSASTAPYKVPRGSKTATYFFAERTSDAQPRLPVNPHIGKPEHIALRWFPVSQLHQRMPKRLAPVIDKLVDWVENKSAVSGLTSETI
jgi:bis(5'-nucleosidyl)-tetraphosphatase